MPEPTRQTLFATTRWTLVGDAAREGDATACEALETLCATYWQPLYRYVRRQGRSPTDAEDLVQSFFSQLLEKNAIRHADPARGRFRAFLLAALKNHLIHAWQHEHRLKRGGFSPHLSIDWQSAETGFEPADPRSPDLLYDRDWALALLDKVLADLARDDPDFDRWKPFLSVASDRLAYGEIATAFGMTEGAARVAVHRLRKRYRQRLREEIARTLDREETVEDEMRALFAALAG